MAAGKSGLWENKTDFALDFGVSYEGYAVSAHPIFILFYRRIWRRPPTFSMRRENIKLRGGRERRRDCLF
ncbi:MAG: hypothetical protein ACLSB9_31065 [Hydrogeniiclostridium mannosilyticum]